MNPRKFNAIVVAAAMLITAAGMTGIAHYSNTTAESVRAATPATADVIKTLPTINVRPSPDQLRQLRKEGNPVGSAATADANPSMPFYSFASNAAGV